MMFQCVADSGRFADPDDPVISPWLWDARPVRLGKSRDEIVADPFESTTEIFAPTVVLMDCEFDTRGVRGVCERKGIRYLTPGSHVGKQGRIERLDRSNVDVFPDTEDSLGPDGEVLYQRAESDVSHGCTRNAGESSGATAP